MENKEMLITMAIILVAIYLYWQNQQSNLSIQPSESKEPAENSQIKELQNQVSHYQKLYQQRVEKDLGSEKTVNEISQQRDKWKDDYEQQNNSLTDYLQGQKVANFTELNEKVQGQEQKITDLESALFNLAKQKIKGKKEAQELLNQLETNWKKDKVSWEQEKAKITNNHQQEKKDWQKAGQEIKANLEKIITEKTQQLQSKNKDYSDLSIKQESSLKTIQDWQQKEQEWKAGRADNKKHWMAKEKEWQQEKKELTEKFDTSLLEKTQKEGQLYQQWEKDKSSWQEEKANLTQQLTQIQQKETELNKLIQETNQKLTDTESKLKENQQSKEQWHREQILEKSLFWWQRNKGISLDDLQLLTKPFLVHLDGSYNLTTEEANKFLKLAKQKAEKNDELIHTYLSNEYRKEKWNWTEERKRLIEKNKKLFSKIEKLEEQLEDKENSE